MKPITLRPFLTFLGSVLVTLTNCVSFGPQSPETAQAKQVSSAQDKNANAVNYTGVSFTLDRSLATEVETETIPASIKGKHSDIWPEHPAFTLVGYPRTNRMRENDPDIRVFLVSKFREAMQHASREMAKKVTSAPTEDWGPGVDEEVRVLKALLSARPGQNDLKGFIRKVRNPSVPTMGTDYPQMPFLPMWEATQAFVAHLRYINFKNGKGVFFLTQWNTETSQVTNAGLKYAYQGITNDGLYYVYAEFRVAAPFLPLNSEVEKVAQWNRKNYLLLHKSKQYQDYLRPVLARLEALPAKRFQPNLQPLEQLIESLEVRVK